jgi:HTH-type transcriptional regulator / antitoxin HigA
VIADIQRNGRATVQVINCFRLHDFWIGHTRGENPMRAWVQLLSSVDWDSPESLSKTFPAAHVHENLAAFDIQGSTYFIVTTIDYQRGIVWVRDVLMHSDFRSDAREAFAHGASGDSRSYHQLVEELPLRPIRDEAQLSNAAARIDSLLSVAELNEEQFDYLSVLSLLIREFERSAGIVPAVSGGEVVRLLVTEHRLSMIELIPLLGSKLKATALLQNTRPLDLRQATRVSRYFKLPQETFMDPDELEIEIPAAPRRRS